MKIVEVIELKLPGLKIIKYAKFGDDRGYFSETFRLSDLKQVAGFEDFNFKQANESYSTKNVVRGLHFQWSDGMGKLVRTISGRMIDIALDIRKDSPTFGKIIFYELRQDHNDDIGQWIWLPPGFAHGNFFTEDTLIEYFCTADYNPECERGISVLSPELDFSLVDSSLKKEFDSIIKKAPLISDKDRNGLTIAAWKNDSNFSQFVFKV